MIETRPPLAPGDSAPDFVLPLGYGEGTVSLSEHRGSPVLLALLRGLYWHFCRRHVVLLSTTAKKLETLGVRTLGVMATGPDQARLFFRFRPPRIRVGCDPALATHRAYGLPNQAVSPELWEAVQVAAVKELQGLGRDIPPAEAYDTVGRLDGYTPTERDMVDFQRHRAQLTGFFLMDRDGIVRWANVECARDGLDGMDQMPSDEEVLEAARALWGEASRSIARPKRASKVTTGAMNPQTG